MKNITLNSNSYDITIGDHSLKKLDVLLRSKKYKDANVFVLLDSNTLQHCYPVLLSKVKVLEKSELIEIEPGEISKDLAICAHIWNALSESGADRKSLLINVGGGVVTDIGGFVASVFKRGIDHMNVPTSLLAMVDASVGNKTGVDLNGLKNEIGSFYAPQGVFVCPAFLTTLDQRNLICGYAEMLKHGLIADAKHWKALCVSGVHSITDELLAQSVSIKNKIVLSDPKEKGKRKLLNFGHTVGHALETYALQNELGLMHGEAVILGMLAESNLSYQKKLISKKQLDEIVVVLTALYQPTFTFDHQQVISLMRYDKKNVRQQINFTLLNSIGKGKIDQTCTEKQIVEALLTL